MIKNKEDILYNLRKIDKQLTNTIFLASEEAKLENEERELERIKRRLLNLMYDIEEVK